MVMTNGISHMSFFSAFVLIQENLEGVWKSA